MRRNDPVAIFGRLNTREPHGPQERRIRTAVVLGGSIAGLLAARVLADHAETVVIIDRDGSETRSDDAPRPGVPQGRQSHLVLPSGVRQLERWLPGIVEEITDAGGIVGQPDAYVDDVRQERMGRVDVLSVTRTLLENRIARRVLALTNVELIAGQVNGLEYRSGAVAGVSFRHSGEDGVLPAGFVVDAMGRGSRMPDWLTRDGWSVPALQRRKTPVSYATAYVHRDDENPDFATASTRYSSEATDKTFATVMPVEGPRWIVTLLGFGDDRPGRDPQDFLTRCAVLPPIFADAVRGQPISDIDRYHLADSRRRRPTTSTRWPAALVSIGDAVSSLNPIRGQGISSTALQASALSEFLGRRPDLTVPARYFFALQTVIVDAAWGRVIVAEASWAAGSAKPSLRQRLSGWTTSQMTAATKVDPELAALGAAVRSMTAHPDTLRRPRAVIRAIRVNSRRGEPAMR